jgi:F-type H+-transporting ATPase subunit epsilon
MATMRVEIVELDGAVWSGEADSVVARTLSGDIGILPGHAPLAALLTETGVVKIRSTEGLVTLAAHGGGMTVQGDLVTILAESAELVGEIDVERAQKALERARSAGEESAEAASAEQRALTRLSLAGHA